MDLRSADTAILTRELMDRAIMQIATSIPAVVESFDSSTMTIEATPAIDMKTYIDEEIQFLRMPKIIRIPILCYGGGGFYHTIPIQKGDYCLLCFSQRAIDNWHDKGGFQIPNDEEGSRHHDLTDAFALFSPFPLPVVLPNYSESAMELRNTTGGVKISLTSDAITITNSTTVVTVANDGKVTVTGDITATGNVADMVGTMADIRTAYNSHTHSETGSTTSVPTPLME